MRSPSQTRPTHPGARGVAERDHAARRARQKEILDAFLAGMPVAQIAEKFKVHQSYPAVLARRAGIARRKANTPVQRQLPPGRGAGNP